MSDKTFQTADIEPIANAALEEHFLSCLLVNPDLLHNYVWFPVDGFYFSANKEIWKAMLTCYREGNPCEITRVASALNDGGMELNKAMPLIANMIDRSVVWQPDSDYTDAYFESLVDQHRRRRLDDFSFKIRGTVRNSQGGWQEGLQEQFASIFSDSLASESTFVELADYDYLNQPDKERISTGIKALDRITGGGLVKGELGILAARPSMGKSAMMVWLACNAARCGHNVDLISAEMDMNSVYERMIGCVAGLVYQDIPHIKRHHRDVLTNAIQKLEPIQRKIAIDCQSKDPDRVLSAIHRSMVKRKPGLIVIDHIHHIAPGTDRESADKVSKFVTALQNLAQSSGTHILILAQLNRGVESRSDKHPMLSDLREFGSLEQLAHLVMLLYRDEYYNKESTTKQGITEIIVGKNRNGATGHVEAITDLSKNRYFDIPEGYGNEF